MLQRTAIGQIGGDTSRTKAMITDGRVNAGCRRAPADHPPGIRLGHRLLGQFDASMSARNANKKALALPSSASGLDTGTHRLGQCVVAGHDTSGPPSAATAFSFTRPG
jgi:hypothetical protein